MRTTLWLPILLGAIVGQAQNSASSSSSSSTTSTRTAASPTPTNPTATLDEATVTGISTSGVHKFLGIPFASPPINNLRFSAPLPVSSYNGSINATNWGYSCPQQNVSFPRIIPSIIGENYFRGILSLIDIAFRRDRGPPENEDCLTVNVMRPDNATASSNLPVVVWIYGGGFETGTTSSYDDDAVRVVRRANELGQPLVYVSMNYRQVLSGWGFLASQEVKDANATNIGLRDQRLALQWVNRYINNFGGDSGRVVLWGQSAGAISASLHMLANNGSTNGLFHGAFMQSGAPIPIGNYTRGQFYYDRIVNQTNCASSNDTLDCLRRVPFKDLRDVINGTPNYYSYSSLDLVWVPRADGDLLTDNPQRLVENGIVANIPIVTGNVDDEGTVFALSSLNVTTDDQFRDYLNYTYLSGVPDESINRVLELYPSNSSDGSPFNTSSRYDITPQYKRSAAFQGDVVFQAPRRFFIEQRAGQQPVWSYLSTRGKNTPFIGSFHSSDLVWHVLDDYLVRFVSNLDPNNGTGPQWPQYDNSSKQLYAFTSDDRNRGVGIITDDYRVPQMAFLTNLSLAYPL